MSRRTALAFAAALSGALGGCHKEMPVELFVDGFEPKDVRFETEDLGPLDEAKFDEMARRGDIDGTLRLSAADCPRPCRAAIVSVFVHNMAADAKAPPVVRIKTPEGKPERLPIGFRGKQINQGRVGRIRWLVQMYPGESALTATVSASVFVVDDPTAPKPADPTEPNDATAPKPADPTEPNDATAPKPADSGPKDGGP
jgi:hypothetical protein